MIKYLPLTKTNLNKIIKWKGSRYNDKTKAQVIDTILKVVEDNRNCEMEFSCGSWTTNDPYIINYSFIYEVDSGIVKIKLNGSGEPWYYLIKLSSNKEIKEKNDFEEVLQQIYGDELYGKLFEPKESK